MIRILMLVKQIAHHAIGYLVCKDCGNRTLPSIVQLSINPLEKRKVYLYFSLSIIVRAHAQIFLASKIEIEYKHMYNPAARSLTPHLPPFCVVENLRLSALNMWSRSM
jgi:hypothetical protein